MSRLSHDSFVQLFESHFHRLYRYLDRLCGEPELAAELAQDAFLRLYERGSLPERPEAWLVTVGTNLLRNARSKGARRSRLIAEQLPGLLLASGAGTATTAGNLRAAGTEQRVRSALQRLPERDRALLLLRAEGFAYREIAEALDLKEASVGTLLARAKRTFLELYEGPTDASR